MNPLTNVKNITKLNETELATGSIHKKSWHDMYKDSAWIFIGGLDYGLTEGDVIAVFSQYGEIENINLVRDKKTGKSKGYCFLCYSNQKSTILAVDNLNGIKLCHRTIRVDHVANYKPPKENERDDEITKILKSEGCAPQVVQKLVTKNTPEIKNDDASEDKSKKKKSKKEKKEKKRKKRKHRSGSSDSDKNIYPKITAKVKEEKNDPGYDKYDNSFQEIQDTSKRHCEKRSDYSNGESSYGNDRSKINKNYKIKIEPESDRECFKTDRKDNISHSSKKHKRKKSSSSSDKDNNYQTSDSRKRYKFSNDSDGPKMHLKHKRKSKKIEESSSSSTDNSSSTQSSSEDENQVSRYSRKNKHKTYYENESNQENNKNKSYHKAGNSYLTNKTKHSDKTDKHADHKSSTKYNDRNESLYKNSHHYNKKSNK